MYVDALRDLEASGELVVSSGALGRCVGVSDSSVRSDLNWLGVSGLRGIGYDVRSTIEAVEAGLGLRSAVNVAVVGAGRLGRAIADSLSWASGVHLVALADVDPSIVGERVGDTKVIHIDALADVMRVHAQVVGVIATPVRSAQDVAEHLVDAGAVAILNFAPTPVLLPTESPVRNADLPGELRLLRFLASTQT